MPLSAITPKVSIQNIGCGFDLKIKCETVVFQNITTSPNDDVINGGDNNCNKLVIDLTDIKKLG